MLENVESGEEQTEPQDTKPELEEQELEEQENDDSGDPAEDAEALEVIRHDTAHV